MPRPLSVIDKSLNACHLALLDAHKDGYNEGINKGRAIAERILVWFLANPQLKKPETIETLEDWSRRAIAELEYRS